MSDQLDFQQIEPPTTKASGVKDSLVRNLAFKKHNKLEYMNYQKYIFTKLQLVINLLKSSIYILNAEDISIRPLNDNFNTF